MQALISLDQDRLTMELEAQSDILEQKGCSDLAILACQQIAPLLMERKAIQGWIRDRNRADLLAAHMGASRSQ